MVVDSPEKIAYRLKEAGANLISLLTREVKLPISDGRIAKYKADISDAVTAIMKLAEEREHHRVWNAAVLSVARGTSMNTVDAELLIPLGRPAHLRAVDELEKMRVFERTRAEKFSNVTTNAVRWHRILRSNFPQLYSYLLKDRGDITLYFAKLEAAIAAIELQEMPDDE